MLMNNQAYHDNHLLDNLLTKESIDQVMFQAIPNGHAKSAKTPVRGCGAVVGRCVEGVCCCCCCCCAALEATSSSRASRVASCELLGS